MEVDRFSDDTSASSFFQLDAAPAQPDIPPAVNALSTWAALAEAWFIVNRVKPNVDKSVFMYVSSRYSTHLVPSSPLVVRDSSLAPVKECTYLGVTIDAHLALSTHIRNIFHSAYFYLHRIGKIRRDLDAQTTLRLVHAFVLSRIEYCNATFAGLPSSLLDRMQKVINAAARLVLRIRRREHMKPHLKHLRWLPISKRIDFKLAVHAYRCLCRCEDRQLPAGCSNCSAPLYLSFRLRYHIPGRNLRSRRATDRNLVVPPYRTITHGDRAFSRSCSLVWKSLPSSVISSPNIHVFPSRLRTHLLELSYPK